jgi:hypothetical protein
MSKMVVSGSIKIWVSLSNLAGELDSCLSAADIGLINYVQIREMLLAEIERNNPDIGFGFDLLNL